MNRTAARLALVSIFTMAARGVAAQEVTPTFHRGQWAGEFSGGSGTSVGLMRFFNPRSALVFSVNGAYSHQTATPDGGVKQTMNILNLGLALGVRRHASIAPRVLATNELGVNMFLGRQKATQDAFGNPVTYRQSASAYGVYWELGGQYFVASHLALGSVATLNANVTSGRVENNGSGTDTHGLNFSTALRPIRITLYF